MYGQREETHSRAAGCLPGRPPVCRADISTSRLREKDKYESDSARLAIPPPPQVEQTKEGVSYSPTVACWEARHSFDRGKLKKKGKKGK